MVTESAWSVPGAKSPPMGKKGQIPPQLTEAILAGEWDVSDVEKRMVGDFMKQFGMDKKKGK